MSGTVNRLAARDRAWSAPTSVTWIRGGANPRGIAAVRRATLGIATRKVQELAQICVTGCEIVDTKTNVALPDYQGFRLRLVARSAGSTPSD